jgi:hypothetical protein
MRRIITVGDVVGADSIPPGGKTAEGAVEHGAAGVR